MNVAGGQGDAVPRNHRIANQKDHAPQGRMSGRLSSVIKQKLPAAEERPHGVLEGGAFLGGVG